MKSIYEFYFVGRYYRSTNRELLNAFATHFSMVVEIKIVGAANYDIELERV
jgi:hypothetical protein